MYLTIKFPASWTKLSENLRASGRGGDSTSSGGCSSPVVYLENHGFIG